MKARHLLAAMLAFVIGRTAATGGPSFPPTGGPPVPPVAEHDAQDFLYLGGERPILVRLHVRIDGKPVADVWRDFIGKLFNYLDQNGDGILSKDEATRVPPAQVLFNNVPNFLGRRPNVPIALDRNRDGAVTRAELADWYRRIGAEPFQFGMGNTPQYQLVRAVNGRPSAMSADALNNQFFALLDTDKDGKLSRTELAQAPDLLRKLDLDDDEMISVQEISGNMDSSATSLPSLPGAFAPQAPNNRPFLLVKSGAPSTALAQRLLDHYGRKGRKTPAEQITRRDLGIDEASFKRLDRNKNGRLDADELERFSQRDPDLEFRVRLGKNDRKEAAIEMVQRKGRPSPLTKSIRPGVGGSLVLQLGTTRIELGRGEPSSAPQFAVRLRQQYLAQFRRADNDNNGYLDNKEASQSPLYRNLFRMLDRDGDGKVFEKEVIAYLDKMKELQESALRSCASLVINDRGQDGHGLFDLIDTNNDGRLSVRELRQLGRLVDQLDSDGDGQIGRADIPHKYRLDVRRGPALGNQFTPRVVVLRRMGRSNQPELPERNGPRWFQKMDRNHDGDVSRREFLGTEQEFRQIDRNNDGLLSIEEAKNADQMFRKEKER